MKKFNILRTFLISLALLAVPMVNAFADDTAATSAPTTAPTETVSPLATSIPSATATPAATASPEATEEVSDNEQLYNEIKAYADEVDLGDPDESFTGDINVYMNWGTVGPLYSLLNIYQDIDAAESEGREPTKTFMWYERPNTIDPDMLPEHVVLMNEISSDYDNAGFNSVNTKICMGFMMKIYETYPNAHYTFYTDDLRTSYEFLMMNYIGVEDYDLVLESDGTASYTYVKSLLYPNSDASDTEAALDEVKAALTKTENNYNGWKKQITGGTVQSAFLTNNGAASQCMWAAAKQSYTEYWLQWPELVGSAVDGLNEYLTDEYGVNFVKKIHNEMYASLSDESKTAFLNAVLSAAMGDSYPEDTDFKAVYDETYFPGYADGSEKYIIISGTSPSGEGSSEAFEECVNNVMAYFGDEYTYLYKPHPRYPASAVDGREEFLESKGIVELPNQTPMETIMWAYPDVYVGGYNSSLYMSATTEGQVKFFLASGPDVLTAPLPDMYELGYFSDVVFFDPDLVPDISTESTAKVVGNNIVVTTTASDDISENVLHIALYDENDVLVNYIMVPTTVSENSAYVVFKDDDSASYAKVFVWNSLDDMEPMSRAETVAIER